MGSITKEELERRERIFHDGLIVCCTCLKEQPFNKFNKNSSKSGGKNGYDRNCKACRKKITREFHIKIGAEEYARRTKISNLKKNYGITLDQYKEMLDKQDGKCAICKGTETYQNKAGIHNKNETGFSVDHSHTTGLIRGLLCRKCNSAIGYFREDPSLLERAIKYLKQELDEQIPNGIRGKGYRI